LTNKHISGGQIDSGKISNDRLNMGSGNGLDADTVDGQHYDAIASAIGDVSHRLDEHINTDKVTDASGSYPGMSVGYANSAGSANNANYANSAGSASSAGYASSAGNASNAGNADTVDGKHANDFARNDCVKVCIFKNHYMQPNEYVFDYTVPCDWSDNYCRTQVEYYGGRPFQFSEWIIYKGADGRGYDRTKVDEGIFY